MSLVRRSITAVGLFALLLMFGHLAYSQSLTGNITGRATDASGGLLPGVTVTVTSPAMIGGGQTAVTDGQGVYRFTLLPPGEYRVAFALSGFATLNVENVLLSGGSTTTINGKMQLASLQTSVTVISQTPAIDLKATDIGTNWDAKKFEDLPYARGIRGLALLLPGLTMTQFDVGGSTVGGSTTTGARSYGRSGDELSRYDGVVWDQHFGDYDTYEQVQTSAAAKGAEAQTPGLGLDFLVKSGSNAFRGTYLGAYQAGAFQSNNVNQDLLDRGFVPGNNKFTRYSEFHADLGGPIIRDRLWFYAAYGQTYSGEQIPGFISTKTGDQVVFFTRIQSPTVKLTYQVNQNNKLEVTQLVSRKYQPYRGASPFTPLEASEDQNSLDAIGPAVKWNYIMSQHMTVDLGANRAGYWWPDIPWTENVRRVDLTTTQTRGAFLAQYRKPVRWGWNGTWSWFTELHGISHEIKSGFLGYRSTTLNEYTGYPNQQIYRYRSLPGESDYFLHPDSVQVFDYPSDVISGINYDSWFLNDNVALSRKLTINAGLRFDHYSSWLPEQGNPGIGPFAQKLVYPETHDFPVYSAWSPRLSMIYDLTGTGTVALKASYGRYSASGSSVNAASGPIAANVNPAATRILTYSNWDGSTPYVPVPANLASISGGSGTQRIDPDTKPAYEDEYTAGVDLGLWRDVVVRLNAVRKMDFNESLNVNEALPFDAFSDLRTGIDPGPDNIAGTADDGTVDVWSVSRSNPNFRTINTLFTNGDRRDRYTAFEATLNKRYSDGWSMLTSYSLDRHTWQNNTPQNPNEARYNWALPELDQQVHLNGMYDRLPWGLKLSATYTAQSGTYFPRVTQVRNALNQLVNVTVDGHAGRYNWVKLMNARVSKVVKIGNQSIEGMIDFFNLLNSNVVISQVNTNGPDYLRPLSSGNGAATAASIPAPRIFRLTLRWTF